MNSPLTNALEGCTTFRPALIREKRGRGEWRQGMNVCACGAIFEGAHSAHVAAVVLDLLRSDEARKAVERVVRPPYQVVAEATRDSIAGNAVNALVAYLRDPKRRANCISCGERIDPDDTERED